MKQGRREIRLSQKVGIRYALIDAERRKLDRGREHPVTDNELASHLMYPKVFAEFRQHRDQFGDVGVLPTHSYFYGMQPQEEVTAVMEDGRQVVIRYLTGTGSDERGFRRLFFEINGQPSSVLVQDNKRQAGRHVHEKADGSNPNHVAAPMPGVISTVPVEAGQEVKQGDLLLTMEAMKMETAINAEKDARVKRVIATIGTQFDAKDLLIELE